MFQPAVPLCLLLLLSGRVAAAEPLLADPSFEEAGLPSWSIVSGNAGPFEPQSFGFPAGAPDGDRALFVNGPPGSPGTVSQTLTGVIEASTVYRLSYHVGAFPGESEASGPGAIIFEYGGLSEVVSIPGGVALDGDFESISVDLLSTGPGATDPVVGLSLGSLEIRSLGTLAFDVVQLEAIPVPEPSARTVGLVAASVAAWLGLRNRIG